MKTIVCPTLNRDVEEVIYNIDDFPYEKYTFMQSSGYRKTYINLPATFDIEATTIKDREFYALSKKERLKAKNRTFSVMYIWQFCLGEDVCIGRTWEEFQTFLKRLKSKCRLGSKYNILPIYVHYLPYEWQFIRKFFEWDNVFAREERKPMRAKTGCFEFRCSYVLSNMSLSKFCENTENVMHYKLDGKHFDYDKLRYPWTELSEEELAYCYNDVRGLAECIAHLYKEDNAYEIPMTSTGYVRRDCRDAMKQNKNNRKIFEKTALTQEQYQLCKDAFRGGDTHANFLWANEWLRDIDSFDLSSSYPAWMMLKKFPMSKFIEEDPRNISEIDTDELCFIGYFKFTKIKLKKGKQFPYIPKSKCLNINTRKDEIENDIKEDNGRILFAENIVIALTDIDYRIIKETYDYKAEYCNQLFIAKYDYLPKELRNIIMLYYSKKCTLKDVIEKLYEYTKSKNKLNAIYGMIVTDILNDDLLYSNDTKESGWEEKEKNIGKVMQHYYSTSKNFLPYQWGVWVTAHARNELRNMLEKVGCNAIYCDTDSIKCFKGYKEIFKQRNEEIKALYNNVEIKPVVDGKYMGIWEYEGTYRKFKTLGAKKYCVQTSKGKWETTVAGLGKSEGAAEIERLGPSAFSIGHEFVNSGRTEAIYDDADIHTIQIDGHDVLTASSIGIVDSSYTLGVTGTYLELISK